MQCISWGLEAGAVVGVHVEVLRRFGEWSGDVIIKTRAMWKGGRFSEAEDYWLVNGVVR